MGDLLPNKRGPRGPQRGPSSGPGVRRVASSVPSAFATGGPVSFFLGIFFYTLQTSPGKCKHIRKKGRPPRRHKPQSLRRVNISKGLFQRIFLLINDSEKADTQEAHPAWSKGKIEVAENAAQTNSPLGWGAGGRRGGSGAEE